MSDYSTHPEWRALLAAIRANRADDLPRLVAADWLEEHGEPDRATFIRIQCRIDQLISGTTWVLAGVKNSRTDVVRVEVPTDRSIEPELSDLYRREEAVLLANPSNPPGDFYSANLEVWLPPPLGVEWAEKFGRQPPRRSGELNGGHVDYRVRERRVEFGPGFAHSLAFRKGFIAEVMCPFDDWLRRGQFVATAGAVERVGVTDREPFRLPDGKWWWAHTNTGGGPQYLADEIWKSDRLSSPSSMGRQANMFDTLDDAVVALSDALIAWALAQSAQVL